MSAYHYYRNLFSDKTKMKKPTLRKHCMKENISAYEGKHDQTSRFLVFFNAHETFRKMPFLSSRIWIQL